MKKVIIFIFIILICFKGLAQPIINRASATNTVQDGRWMGQYNAFMPRYNDTTSANLQKGIDSCGALIYTRDVAAIWFRACTGYSSRVWIQIQPAGSSSGQNPWLIGGNNGLFTSPVDPQYAGTKTVQGFGFKTSDVARLTIPSTGIARTSDAAYKYLMFDTSGSVHLMGYGDGGSGSSGWSLTGNAGTTAGTNFLGTTDAVGLMGKVNNVQSFYLDYNTGNSSFGQSALLANTTGTKNNAFGDSALKANTSGTQNVAVGNQALFSNILGGNNIAIGYEALRTPIAPTISIAIGNRALYSSTPDGEGVNIAIGSESLFSNDLGTNNIAVGTGSLHNNTNGSSNVSLGPDAMTGNTTGDSSTAIGEGALEGNTTGNNNIAVGWGAGKYNTTENYRIYLNSLDRTDKAGDTTESPYYAVQDAVAANQRTYINSKLYAPYIQSGVGDKSVRWNSSTKEFTYADTTTGGAGSGTVNSGTQYRLGYYATTGTAISEAAAITANRALISDANGVPTHSTVSATQVGYLSSATGTTGTASTNLVFSENPTITGTLTLNSTLLTNSANSTSTYQYRVGTFLNQSYALNNGFISDNAYFNGASWTRLTTGYATGFQFYNGQLMVHNIGSGTGNFTQAVQMKVDKDGVLAIGSNVSVTPASYTGATIYLDGTNGRAGLGTTSPTAVLHIKAGTATASTAPLKFTSGVASQTVKEAGAINYDGSDLTLSDATYAYTLSKTLNGSATLDFGNTTAQTSTDLTITVTGAADGDVVMLGAPNGSVSGADNVVYFAWVSAANTVTVRFSNNNVAAAVDPASGTFKVRVIK